MTTYEVSSLFAYWVQASCAFATFIIAILVYRKFLPQKLAESQLSLVLELIKALADSKYRFEQVDRALPGGPGSYALYFDHKNTFELAMLHSNMSELPSLPVFLPSNYSTGFSPSPFSYLGNPLLPDAIAKSMNKLRRNLIYIDKSIADFDKYIVIGSKQLESQAEFVKVELYELEGGMSSLVESCKETTQEIIKWLSNHGIKDLNYLVLQPESKTLFYSPFPEL